MSDSSGSPRHRSPLPSRLARTTPPSTHHNTLALALELDKNPHDSSNTSANVINIVFDPDDSKKVSKCERIVHIQFRRGYLDGNVINPADYSPVYEHKRNLMTTDGWAVDCLAGETTPDYQQGTGDGKKNGGSAKASMSDAPQTGGGSKGFYDPVKNPSGWKTYRIEFLANAYCMKGSDWRQMVRRRYVGVYKKLGRSA